jgi:hypothetical protein
VALSRPHKKKRAGSSSRRSSRLAVGSSRDKGEEEDEGDVGEDEEAGVVELDSSEEEENQAGADGKVGGEMWRPIHIRGSFSHGTFPGVPCTN